MDRKLYLDMMQKEAIDPDSQTVSFGETNYEPIAYQLSFRDDGSTRHTAVLRNRETNYCCYCPLENVKEAIKNPKIMRKCFEQEEIKWRNLRRTLQ